MYILVTGGEAINLLQLTLSPDPSTDTLHKIVKVFDVLVGTQSKTSIDTAHIRQYVTLISFCNMGLLLVMTENLINSLIGLFGTISAISIAYLVLLYDQAQNKIKNHKQYLICEIQGCLNCYRVKNNTRFNDENELKKELLEKCDHNSISLDATEKLISQLKEEVNHLDSLVEKSNNAEAGEKAKLARHIEKYHHDDIQSSLSNYKDAENFYSKFPKRSKFGIGIPLFFSAIFVILSVLKINSVFDDGYIFSSAIAALALIGLYLTYHTAINTLKELRGLDD